MSEKTWRVGTKVPINVYEGDRPICQCHTVLDAKRIVEAVNRAGAKSPFVSPVNAEAHAAHLQAELEARRQELQRVYKANHENAELFRAADARCRVLEEARRWIPVDEKLPKRGQLVLVYGDHWNLETYPYPLTEAMQPDPKLWFDCPNVTHWMPVPARP